LKSCCVVQDHYYDERDKIVFLSQRNNRPARPRPQCTRPRPKPIFMVSDRSCPKTDGLRTILALVFNWNRYGSIGYIQLAPKKH